LPEGQVTGFIERLLKQPLAGGEDKDALKDAEAALAAGDVADAAARYAEILSKEPDNIAALAGLARAYLETDATEQAKQTLALVPEAKRNDPAVAAARAALQIAEQARSVGPIGELEQKIAADPLDHQSRLDLALAFNAAGRRQEAADQLLETVKRDRKWNDDAARKQLVQFFDAWGPDDPATVEGRKRLSSILFS
jgi:putative thioredoxin